MISIILLKTEKMFNELKRTLKIKTEEAQWAREEGQQELLKKIDSLELALPVIPYFKNRDLLYNEYNMSQVIFFTLTILSKKLKIYHYGSHLVFTSYTLKIEFQIILYDNYFNNSMTLLKRYRILIYAELKREVGDPKQM